MADNMTNDLLHVPAEYYVLGDGAKLRYAVFEPEGTPRGTFLLMQGRREFIEKKYLEAGRDLRARGFRIISFDWRGQGLSSRFFEGLKRQHDHVVDFNIHISDLRQFYRDIVKPRQSGPFFIFAHSMGALIASHWLSGSDAPDVKAAIFTVPALEIGVPTFAPTISSTILRLGFGERYAVGQHDYNDRDRRFAGNVLSHDRMRFSVIEKYFDTNPDLRVGGVTWGWLSAALKFSNELKQPGYLEHIRLPMLGLFCGRDIVTPPAKTIPLFRRMRNAEAVTIPGALHDLMIEADRYRDEAWRHIDLFLKRVIRE